MKKIIFTMFTVLWMVAIFSFSAKPADESTEMSLSVGRMIADICISDFGEWPQDRQAEFVARIDYPVRKCAHASEYAVLGILLAGTVCSYGVKGIRGVGGSAAAGIIYAASDEFHQLFVPGRSGQITDVMIDGAGLIAGIAVFCLLVNICKRRRERNIVAETARKP